MSSETKFLVRVIPVALFVCCVFLFQIYTLSDVLIRTHRNLIGERQGFGHCSACLDTWNWKPNHITSEILIFVLCQECWLELTPEQRLPFYLDHVKKKKEQNPDYFTNHRTKDGARFPNLKSFSSWEEYENHVKKVVLSEGNDEGEVCYPKRGS